MINLELLEEEIDNLLAKETTSSLLSWLYDKRFTNLHKRLGQGTFENINGALEYNQIIVGNIYKSASICVAYSVSSIIKDSFTDCYELAA